MNAMAPVPAMPGHNELSFRLDEIAVHARRGLDMAAKGEADTIDGWLAFGAALNEGRALFPSDEQFGQWVAEAVTTNLVVTPRPEERAAAMWAAANGDQFSEAREAGNARTVRGIHAKWKEIEAEREAEAKRAEAEKARKEAEEKAAIEAEERRKAKEAKGEKERAEAEARAEKAALEKLNAEKKATKAKKEADKAEKKATGKGGGNAHVANNSGDNEWYTPPAFIDAARSVMGGIDLDPATSIVANKTVGAVHFFTAEDDGLSKDWPVGRIWMNPPYAAPLIGQFSERLSSEVERGSEAVVLVNNGTETAWFQRMGGVCSAVCFPKSRVKFLDPNGDPSGAPLQGQAVIYFGPNTDAFEREFGKFGLVLRNG